MQKLNRFVKTHPLPYTLWFHLYRRWRGVPVDWFSNHTQLYIDGYPRSGNTFSLFLIRNLWPDLCFVHHLHATAPLKIALKRNIPTFILVRDPADAISSNYLKQHVMKGVQIPPEINQKMLLGLLAGYVDYHDHVLAEENLPRIIAFDDLISQPDIEMLRVNSTLPNTWQYSTDRLIETVNSIRHCRFGAKDELGSSLPNATKESEKIRVISALSELPDWSRAVDLYRSIINRSRQIQICSSE